MNTKEMARQLRAFADELDPPTRSAPASPSPADGPRKRFGRGKGTPLAEASDEELEWYSEALTEMCGDPRRERYASENRAHLAEVRDEQERRAGA